MLKTLLHCFQALTAVDVKYQSDFLSLIGGLALCLKFFIMITSHSFVCFPCFHELDFPGPLGGGSCEGVGKPG